MSKVAVVYWSSTGNTESMANAVAEGAKAAGAEVTAFEASESRLAVRLWAMKFLRKTNLNQCSAPAKQSFPAKKSDFSVPMDGETENGCMIGKKNAKKTVQFLYPTVSFARKNQMTMR